MKAIPLNAEIKVINKELGDLFANFKSLFEPTMKVELFISFYTPMGHKDMAVINNSMNWMSWKL